MVMHVELQATCSALGYQEGQQYIKEPDCLETVKDLIRFLKREDETCDIRRQLGHAQVVQNDLLPILKQYKSDDTLWETVIRLLVNLTQPGVLCFNGFVPEDKSLRNNYLEVESHLQAMKEAFIDDDIFSVLTEKLGELLKLDWEHRQEEHRLLIERILILIRNILHIPPNPEAEQRTDDDASVHDQVLWAIHVSGLEDLLLYIASSDEERNLSMHILEIVSLMFREQTPDVLASAGTQRSQTEKQKDERELEMVREQERLQKKANVMKFSSRHSRFGGTFVVKNFKSISDNDLICHKAQVDVDLIELDKNKKPKKKPKNRKPLIDKEITRRSTLSIRLGLKEFCVQFLENCYNPLMYAVKDILNREKSQEHDETYYLWAMRFFMEFCRLYNHQVDFVSETMSVQTFHYIQVQLYQYYEMQTMEKKEAITWGKRASFLMVFKSLDCVVKTKRVEAFVDVQLDVAPIIGFFIERAHLALKAYQELLLTLDSMDRSGNETLIASSKVIKSNIFYVTEFRDVFLTLLRHFDESRFSRSYLKDLIETTHLFLKMLDNYSKKTGHLVVQSKKRKIRKKAKQQTRETQGVSELNEQELEDLWDEISGELSAIFQGRSEIPDSVAPFDAASEVDVDQQRVDAMIRIQDCLRNRKPGEGVALFRAAREVWPERNEFGTPDISPEDEFMALREIFFTNLPRPLVEIPEAMEDEAEIEEEDEEIASVVTSETEFVFRDFVVKFAKPEILKPYVVLLADFQTNSTHTNHCCVKLLHRVAVDLGYVGMLFQISVFRVFQKIINSPLAKAQRYKELAKFSVFIVRKFVEVAQNNPKAFMELWFWKSNKDSIELVEGYGSYKSKGKVLWDEQGEMEVRRLFEEYQDQDTEDKDVVDCIMENITDPTKTRGQIIRELKRQELITSAKDLKRPKGNVRAWREEEELELRELFEKYKDESDPVGSIMADMCKKRSRQTVMKKILSLELVEDRKDLYKRRGKSDKTRTRRRRGGSDSEGEELQELKSDFEDEVQQESNSDASRDSRSSDSGSEGDSETEKDTAESENTDKTMTDIISDIVRKGYKDQIAWIQRGVNRAADDREEDDLAVPIPLVPLTEENETAMEDSVFLAFLTAIGISPPANEQEAFWRIPANLTAADLRNISQGLALNENDEPLNANQIKMHIAQPKSKKDKKRKRKKEKQTTEKKERKNASKISALNDLIKKKVDAKKNKRIRKKDFVVDSDTTGNHDAGNIRKEGESSAKKKKRVQKFVESDSDSDVPLSSMKMQTVPESVVSYQENESTNTHGQENKPEEKNEENLIESDIDEDQSSKPLLFLSSSDDSDNEKGSTKTEVDGPMNKSDDEGESHTSKRSRSSDAESEETDHPAKKARVVDEEKDAAREDTFPATMYTQGVDSDSDIDDHVPLRKAIQKRNMIESDDDDD